MYLFKLTNCDTFDLGDSMCDLNQVTSWSKKSNFLLLFSKTFVKLALHIAHTYTQTLSPEDNTITIANSAWFFTPTDNQLITSYQLSFSLLSLRRPVFPHLRSYADNLRFPRLLLRKMDKNWVMVMLKVTCVTTVVRQTRATLVNQIPTSLVAAGGAIHSGKIFCL